MNVSEGKTVILNDCLQKTTSKIVVMMKTKEEDDDANPEIGLDQFCFKVLRLRLRLGRRRLETSTNYSVDKYCEQLLNFVKLC